MTHHLLVICRLVLILGCVFTVIARVCAVGCMVFFVQAEDGIRDLVRSRGLGDVYKRQAFEWTRLAAPLPPMLPSLNQIGFDYLDWIVGTVDLSLIHI